MSRQMRRGLKGNVNPLQAELARADALIAAGQLADAVAVLAELNKQFRDNPEVLLRMLDLAVAADNAQAILATAVPLARLRPNDPGIALNLAIARLKTRHLALAQRAFAAFATRWPGHEQAEQARRQAQELGAYLATLWAENGLEGPPDLDLMARNEEVQNLLSAGDWPQEAIMRRLAAEHPDYLFGVTNLVPYLINEGKLAEAQALIDPLLRRKRMHFGEFGAVASAQVSLLIAEGKFDAAESWLEMWEQARKEKNKHKAAKATRQGGEFARGCWPAAQSRQ